MKTPLRSWMVLALVALAGAAPARAQSAVVESEPNHTPLEADSAALGADAAGVIDPQLDVDTWFVDLTAGTFLSVDVDAEAIGSPLDPVMALIGPDGHTTLAFNDDFDGLDSRISFRIRESGRYYVAIRAFGNAGAPELRYVIHFRTVVCDAVATEREPNGTAVTATPLSTEGVGTGQLCAQSDDAAGDVDVWAFTAQAGTTIELDVDVTQVAPVLAGDPFVALFATDGTTRLAFNDDADGSDSRLQFSILVTGTYFAAVSTVADPGGNPFPYALHVRTVAAGAGDPIVVRAQGLGLPAGIAVGSTGDLFVGEWAQSRVVRINAAGVVTPFVTGILVPFGLAFDAFDHLLVASQDGKVYRVTPEGQATPFITDAGIPLWIAVAPDGHIWLTDASTRSVRRYSRTGVFEARFDGIPIGGSGPGSIAIGPSGEPWVSNGTELWKLSNGQFTRVVRDAPFIVGFAFDVAGNIYAAAPTAGRIMQFTPTGAVLADPFAVGPDFPLALAFGRDGAGATVARVFATERQAGTVIELNPGGITHRGLPAGAVPPFSPRAAADGLLGAVGLGADDLLFLDALGNHNGRYDVGDLQAYLRSLGVLAGARSSP